MISLRTRKHSDSSSNLRRGFFIALLILHLFYSVVFSSNSNYARHPAIHGRTLDTDGQSIPYVSLIFKYSEIFLLSDEEGQFIYTAPLLLNDSILVQRIGYQQKIITIDELLLNNDIRLKSDVLSMKSVEVQAKSKPGAGVALSSLSKYSKTSGSGTMDHSKLLSRIPGISIKTYGGPAGISTLSMDGGPSSHTKVLVNSIDITSAQNGEADISQLPLPFIKSMNYVPYDITQSSSGGSDGIVKLETDDQQNHVCISKGSFGHLAYDINLRKQVANFRMSIQMGQRRESGNYSVIWDNEESLRQNNGLNQQFAALRILGMLRPDIFWQLTAMGSRQSRGVAGLVWSPDTLSHRNDELQLVGSTFGWIRPNGSTRLQLALRRSQENYVNPYLRLESDHNLQSFQLGLKNEQTFGRMIVLLSDLNFNHDEIWSSDTDHHERNSYVTTIAPVFKLLGRFKLIPSLKFHYSPDLYERSLTDLQIQIPLHFGPLAGIAASRGEVYRYPTFNDQYWEPGGNPDLKPEETQVLTAQIQFDLKRMGSLMCQWQKKESSNLIQWMPVHSYWQPGNVQSATRESSKAIWQFDRPEWYLSAFAHFSLIYTLDNNRQKPLRYAPNQTSAFGLTWSPSPFEINLQYNYVSDRISMYDYPVDTILEATELWSLSIAHTWIIKPGSFTLVFSGDNLGNIRYETIRGYPEPGRSIRLSTTYSF